VYPCRESIAADNPEEPDTMTSAMMNQALQEAEATCSERGVRLTALRRQVLEQILNTEGVIKAYDLIHELGRKDRRIKPPSIYRSLAFLLEQGFIHRIESLNGFVACTHPGELHDSLLMICDLCGTIAETQPRGINRVLQEYAHEEGFRIQGKTLELHGVCRICQANVESRPGPRP
jgi:Fur family zinc uptake transcriptional regulator